MAVLPKDTFEKEGDWCACSPLNSGGRPNTYARKECKAGSYVQESLLELKWLL